jgi:hypothetical protein
MITIRIRPVCLPEPVSARFDTGRRSTSIWERIVNVRNSVLALGGNGKRTVYSARRSWWDGNRKQSWFESWQISSSSELRLPSSSGDLLLEQPLIVAALAVTIRSSLRRPFPPGKGTPRKRSNARDPTAPPRRYTRSGVTLEHTHESLPPCPPSCKDYGPTFNKTDHSVAFGLTFAIQVSGSGRLLPNSQ